MKVFICMRMMKAEKSAYSVTSEVSANIELTTTLYIKMLKLSQIKQ